jgi:hypothetical protein
VVLHAFPSGAKQRTLLSDGPAINGLAFGPASSGGSLLVAASAVGSLRMWDFEAQALLDTFTVHTVRRTRCTHTQDWAGLGGRPNCCHDTRG